MKFLTTVRPAFAAAALLLVAGCSASTSTTPASTSGSMSTSGVAATSGSTGTSGTSLGPSSGNGSAGQTTSGTSGSIVPQTGSASGTTSGSIGGAGSVISATGASTGASGSIASGSIAQSGSGSSGVSASGSSASGTSTRDAGMNTPDAGDPGDPPPPRPLNAQPGAGCNCQMNVNGQPAYFNSKAPIMGKLILFLGAICGTTGAGGIESFVHQYGFHTFSPITQTCVNSAPQMYLNIIATDPMNAEANRQVGDARMQLWDGVARVNWVTVAPGTAIVDRTIAALKALTTMDPASDWGFYLNPDGTLRTTDVWVVGYSWGSQTWAMISSYVRFGRVITTSGPQAERFPNATWITHPSATPGDRKFMAVGFVSDYPSTTPIDIAPNTVTSMIQTTTAGGWIGPPMNVHPGDMGPFAGGQFPMVGSNMHSPGGHTVFCTGDPLNGWIPICKYLFNVK